MSDSKEAAYADWCKGRTESGEPRWLIIANSGIAPEIIAGAFFEGAEWQSQRAPAPSEIPQRATITDEMVEAASSAYCDEWLQLTGKWAGLHPLKQRQMREWMRAALEAAVGPALARLDELKAAMQQAATDFSEDAAANKDFAKRAETDLSAEYCEGKAEAYSQAAKQIKYALTGSDAKKVGE